MLVLGLQQHDRTSYHLIEREACRSSSRQVDNVQYANMEAKAIFDLGRLSQCPEIILLLQSRTLTLLLTLSIILSRMRIVRLVPATLFS